MKILYKNMGFGGGAPRSLLEYAKVALEEGHDVEAAGAMTYEPEFYHEWGIKTTNIPYFQMNMPLYNLMALRMYTQFVRRKKPDLIHVITSEQCVMQRVVSRYLDIPCVYTVAGGVVDKSFAKSMNNEEIIVFSHENKLDLTEYGYGPEKIQVISNRMKFDKETIDGLKVYKKEANLINLLFVGRIVTNKGSINQLLEVTRYLHEQGINVCFRVLGDGRDLPMYKKRAEEINKKAGKKIVEFMGYCTNVSDYLEEAHICFGKGRSVLDAIANLKVSYVAAESGDFFFAKKERIKEISDFNFTGRRTDHPVGKEHILETVRKIESGKIDFDDLKKTRDEVRKYYDVDHARDKIINIYCSKVKNFRKHNYLYRLFGAIGIYVRSYGVYIYYSIIKK